MSNLGEIEEIRKSENRDFREFLQKVGLFCLLLKGGLRPRIEKWRKELSLQQRQLAIDKLIEDLSPHESDLKSLLDSLNIRGNIEDTSSEKIIQDLIAFQNNKS